MTGNIVFVCVVSQAGSNYKVAFGGALFSDPPWLT